MTDELDATCHDGLVSTLWEATQLTGLHQLGRELSDDLVRAAPEPFGS